MKWEVGMLKAEGRIRRRSGRRMSAVIHRRYRTDGNRGGCHAIRMAKLRLLAVVDVDLWFADAGIRDGLGESLAVG